MDMSLLPAHVYMHHVCFWCPREQKESPNALEVEFWMAVNHYVGVGNWTQSSARTTGASNSGTISLAPVVYFLNRTDGLQLSAILHNSRYCEHTFSSFPWSLKTLMSLPGMDCVWVIGEPGLQSGSWCCTGPQVPAATALAEEQIPAAAAEPELLTHVHDNGCSVRNTQRQSFGYREGQPGCCTDPVTWR